MNLLAKIASFVAASVLSASVLAHPIAASGTEGLSVIASGGNVIAKYEGNSAGYSNDLLLDMTFIFNNHATAVGATMDLGSFAAGTELIFQLYVHNTGDRWYTGSGTRNADGLIHARVQENWLPGVTLVSFEDLWGTPEGQNGYNDLSFSFTNTQTTPVGVPETSGLLLMLLGLAGLAAARRKNA